MVGHTYQYVKRIASKWCSDTVSVYISGKKLAVLVFNLYCVWKLGL